MDLESKLSEAMEKLDQQMALDDMANIDTSLIESALNIIQNVKDDLRLHKGTLDTATAALREQAEDLDRLAGELY